MKKIAILHYAYPPNLGGVEKIIRQHAHILKDLGFKVSVLTGSGKADDEDIEVIKIKEFQSIDSLNPALQKKILQNLIFDEEFSKLSNKILEILERYLNDKDVVIVHNMLSIGRNLAFVQAFSSYTRKNPEKKFINWIHDHMYIEEDRIKENELKKSDFIRKLLTEPIKNTIYVAISGSFKALLEKIIPNTSIKVIPNGVYFKDELAIDGETWKLVEKHNLLSKTPLFICPVIIVERKNIEYSLEVVRFLKNSYPGIMAIITGDTSKHKNTLNYYDRLRDIVKRYDIEKNVLFLKEENMTKRIDMHDLYILADGIFYFSKSENFGLPIIESSLFKTPIYLSSLRPFHEVGQNYLKYFDINKIKPDKISEIIKADLEKDSNFFMRNRVKEDYNLENILKERLVPLIE